MPRNLNRRVETLVKIENKTVHKQILDQIMVSNLRDNVGAWLMQPDGRYTSISDTRSEDESAFSAHEYFMTNPSLSGMGRVQTKDGPKRSKNY